MEGADVHGREEFKPVRATLLGAFRVQTLNRLPSLTMPACYRRSRPSALSHPSKVSIRTNCAPT
jgi:hypothetical protein